MKLLLDEDYRKKTIERAEIVLLWFDWIEGKYDDMISREESASAPAGFDAAPVSRPCEHRREWRRGKLCLACDNTGWRKSTAKEKQDGIAFDPYAFEVPDTKVKVNDSASSKFEQEAAKITSILSMLANHAAIRAGEDFAEDRYIAQYRKACQKPEGAKVVIAALNRIESMRPGGVFGQFLDRRELAMMVALIMDKSKRLRPPPEDRVRS